MQIKPGIYPNVLHEEYREWDALSSTALRKILRSPATLREHLDNPPPTTPAQLLGTAMHCAILELGRFDAEYAHLSKGCDRRKKEGKKEYEELKAMSINVISYEDYYKCIKAREMLLSMPFTGLELCGFGMPQNVDYELSFVWDEQGTLCKGRADIVNTHYENGALIDVKSCGDARPTKFFYQVRDNKYDVQSAFYQRGLQANGIPCEENILIAVETGHGCNVQAHRIPGGWMEPAHREVQRGIQLYADCVKRNEWPGYEDMLINLGKVNK